jgi:hypothetical protein
MRILKAFFVLLLVLARQEAVAHHSFAAEFVATEMITVEGVVVEVRFRNPHVQYFIDVDVDGTTERWNVQAQNVPSLRRRGWSKDTLQKGDRISVTGFPGRDGARKVYVDSVVTPSGETLTMFDGDKQTAASSAATEAVSLADSSIASQLIGHWGFDVDLPLPGAPLHLEFMEDGGAMKAIFDNEELDVVLGTDSMTIVLARENLGGFPVQMQLQGKFDGDVLRGSVKMISGYTSLPNLNAKTFSATRMDPSHWDHSTPARLAPVDLTGTWRRVISLGPIGRTNPHLNAAGEARHAEFKKGLYDPTLRCMSTGPMRRYAAPGLVEIIASTNRLTILYGGAEIRRIWFDREVHDPERPHDVMGESLGSWDGSTLVIDTRNMMETVLTHNAEPISAEARIVERYWLQDNGELVMEATLHDPTYYARPLVRRTQWRRADGEEIIYTPCDPDSFYRGMQIEGSLEKYFENQPGGEQ